MANRSYIYLKNGDEAHVLAEGIYTIPYFWQLFWGEEELQAAIALWKKAEELEKEEKTEEVVIPEKIEVEDSFDDIKTSGIENEYLGNNNIEESFESTSELETINDADSKMLEEDNYEYTPQTIEESEEEKQENDKLEDTIETDLFNLIDSMYKDDEESGDEE